MIRQEKNSVLRARLTDYFFLDSILEISRIASITTIIMPSTKSIEYTTFVNPLGAGVTVGVTAAVGIGVAVGDAVAVGVKIAVSVGDGVGVAAADVCRYNTLNTRLPAVSISS